MDAEARIHAIRDGVDAIDELVFAEPDPSTWTDDRRQRWDRLSTALATACRVDRSTSGRSP